MEGKDHQKRKTRESEVLYYSKYRGRSKEMLEQEKSWIKLIARGKEAERMK